MIKKRTVGASNVYMNTDPLETLQKVLREKRSKLYVKVGILGKGPVQHGKSRLNNATIGLIHEKGSKAVSVPRRSFLDMPLRTKGPEALKKNSPFLVSSLIKGGVGHFYKILGVIGENVVQAAFETGGFGKWKPLKASTIAKKGSSAILIDTAELRKSIASAPAI